MRSSPIDTPKAAPWLVDYCAGASADLLAPLAAVELGGEERAVTDLLLLREQVILFTAREAMLYSLPDGKLLDACPLPGAVFTSTQMENGTIYCTCRRALYEVKIAK